MLQKIPRKILFYLALSGVFLLLLAGMSQTLSVSAQGSTEYPITLTIFQNTDCSVGRYSVETPEGIRFERLRLKGAKIGDIQCSLVATGSVFGLGDTNVQRLSGIQVFLNSMKLQKAKVEQNGTGLYVETLVNGPKPLADGSPIQQQIILHLGN